MKPRIGSLFSGTGGLDLAVMETFDAEVAWHCEWEAAPSAILEHHWPGVPNFRDVTQIDWATIPPVDILTGGFPCQPFSAAGKRKGEDDERHLWPYVLEAIRALRPKYTLLENVAGLRSIGGDFDEPTRCVCGRPTGWGGLYRSLEDEDQCASPRGNWDDSEGGARTPEDAVGIRGKYQELRNEEREVGLSDPMEREWTGGVPVSECSPASLDPEGGASPTWDQDGRDSTGSTSVERQQGQVGQRVNGALSDDSASDNGAEREGAGVGAGGFIERFCPSCGRAVGDEPGGSVFRSGLGTVFRDLASLGMHVRWTSVRASDVGAPHHRERLFILVTDPASLGPEGGDGITRSGAPRRRREWEPRGSNRRLPPDTEGERLSGQQQSVGVSAERPSIDGSVGALPGVNWGAYGRTIRRWENLTRPAPAPTEPNKNGRPRLNAEFASWMMGLPPGWVTDPAIGISRADQLKAIGNGVCPQQAVAALRYLTSVNMSDRLGRVAA